MKYIDFDVNGKLISSEKIEKILDTVPFSNKILLNTWCNSNFDFECSNGISVESFFIEKPWTLLRGNIRRKYFWGNDTIKKLKNTNFIFGSSPFVYTKEIYDNTIKHLNLYQTVFLPKSDEYCKTQLIQKRSFCREFKNTLLQLNLENPIYISWPFDYDYYCRFLPEKITSRMYSIGYNGFDTDWNMKLLKLISYSSELYFNMISTPCVYSCFLNKNVKFYNSDIQFLPLDVEENINSIYTVDKSKKNDTWHSFMDYIKRVFQDKTEDLNFWIMNFLSLDLVKSPEELFQDLLTLHNDHTRLELSFTNNDYYSELIKKVETFKYKNCSKLSHYYYDRL